ncbi:hypothetical protein A3K64_02000 [Candidatus Micrarchaeota archaeon RBG_16_36_9]|nr:MAG: hypothetical protein A3K64_02000 [Candidatus Micrarchaeota archaeon RBG_16_36_9]
MQIIHMKKLFAAFLLTFIVFSSMVLAEDFTVSTDLNSKNYFVATQTGYITLKIYNSLPEDWFSISLIGPEKWVKVEDSLLRVQTAGSGTTRIIVSPPQDVVPLLYPYQYFLKVTRIGTDSVIEDALLIKVKQITDAIIKDFKLSCTECTDSVDIYGTAYNVGSDPIDLSVVFKFGSLTKTFSLGYVNIYGKKEFKTTFSLNGMSPGDYTIEADLIDVNGEQMYHQSASFNIPAIENIIYDKDVSSSIFGSAITVTATNKGNTVSDVDLMSVYPKSWYSLYSGPTPTGMAIGENYYWKTTIGPNETKKISYSEIYWPTYAAILFGILIAVFIYWQSTTFTFTKSILGGRRARPNKEISVSLNFKNKNKEIDKAIVKDFVPSGYSIVSKFETVKPMIKKVSDGIELDWKMSKLKPNEERVFHYTIRPTEEVSGKLPSARAKVLHDKKLVQRNSNRVSVVPEEEKENKTFAVKVSK